MAHKTTEQKEILRLLKQHGAALERTQKHKIWRFPDGCIFVLPSTPSGAFNWKKRLSDLNKILDAVPADRGMPGDRRQKRGKKQRQKVDLIEAAPVLESFSARLAGLQEFKQSLRVHVVDFVIRDPEWLFMREIETIQFCIRVP